MATTGHNASSKYKINTYVPLRAAMILMRENLAHTVVNIFSVFFSLSKLRQHIFLPHCVWNMLISTILTIQ